MAASDTSLTDRLRRPEYTGENRCAPCTVVNAGIAAVVAVAVGVVEPALGVAVAAASAGAIYLRGYLVPGTPTLTKRYLPARVLAWFGKAPAEPPGESPERTDVEGYLLEVGAVRTAEDDLTASATFAADWYDAMDAVEDDLAAAAGELLGLQTPGTDQRGDAFVVTEDGFAAAEWPSRAALVADLGAVRALADRDDEWARTDRTTQGRILSGLRVFLESCPDCGGQPTLGEAVVASCCREAEVLTYDCTDCGTRLLEIEQ
ncbi:MAG: hypothetical protein ABEJ79_09585 [Halolamina sp.]